MPHSPSADSRFVRIYEAYHGQLQRYCLRRVPPDQINDALAEVFLVVWRRIDEVPGGDETLPWLYGVARRTVSNLARSSRRSTRLLAKLGSLGREPVSTPESMVVRSEEAQAVSDALNRLRPGDREILMLRVWEELSSREIATVLEITPAAVDMRLMRARRRFELALPKQNGPNPVGHPRLAEGGER